MNKIKNKYLAVCHLPRFKDSANGRKVIECDTQWEAVQTARIHYQIKPRDFSMLTVMLVEKDGKQIFHQADF